MKFSFKDFFSKCDQIRSFAVSIFCAVKCYKMVEPWEDHYR